MAQHQRPFLKWPGGKFRLLPRILAHVKLKLMHWHEPFLGSGAVFLNVEAERYDLADANPHLIDVYQTLQTEGLEFVRYVKQYFKPRWNVRARYDELRERFNGTDCPRERAALFVYLNRHGFNGLCRYNQKGIFNVPFGSYQSPYFPEEEMRFFYEKSKRAIFSCQDFKTLFESLNTLGGTHRMIYCDPPYVPVSATASFTRYASNGFSDRDHEDLALLAKQYARQGTPVLVSNHDTPFVRQIYAGASTETFPVMRTISALNKGRGNVQEILALFLPDCSVSDPGIINHRGGEPSQSFSGFHE